MRFNGIRRQPSAGEVEKNMAAGTYVSNSLKFDIANSLSIEFLRHIATHRRFVFFIGKNLSTFLIDRWRLVRLEAGPRVKATAWGNFRKPYSVLDACLPQSSHAALLILRLTTGSVRFAAVRESP